MPAPRAGLPAPGGPLLRRRLSSLLVLLLSGSALAGTPCNREYRVGVSPIGYSYYLDAEGQPTGSSFDFYEELSRRSGCRFQLDPMPRARAWYLLERHQVDLITPTFRTPERDHLARFVEYFKTRSDLLIRRELGPRIKSLSDFLDDPALQLGMVRGHVNGPRLDDRLTQLPAARLQLSPDAHNVFIRMMAGRVDGTLMTAGLYQKEVDMLDLHDQLQLVRLPEADALPTGAYLSRLSLSLSERRHLEQHIRAMLNDGTLRTLLSRRHGKPLTDRYYELPAPATPPVAD